MLCPLTDSLHIGLLVHPPRTYSFAPQLHEQLSSAIKPGPVTLVNGIQCSLRDKILLHLTVSSKTSTSNIKDGGLEVTPQFFRISKARRPPKSPLILFANSSATLSSLFLPTSSLDLDGTFSQI